MDESTVTARKEICHANMSGSNSILAEVNGNCKTGFKWGREQTHDAEVKNEKTLLFNQRCF